MNMKPGDKFTNLEFDYKAPDVVAAGNYTGQVQFVGGGVITGCWEFDVDFVSNFETGDFNETEAQPGPDFGKEMLGRMKRLFR